MKKINELNPTIFVELEKILPDLKLFTLDNGDSLDSLYIFKYGERVTTDNLDSVKVAGYLKTLYSKNWDKAFDLFTAGDNLMIDFGNMSSKVTTKEYGYTDTVSDLESVPAFDVETAELDRKNERSLVHVDDVNKTTVTQDDKDISKFNASWEYITKNYIDDVIFNDVNKLITMRVHN